MRIIAGKHRGRTFALRKGAAARPTADRVREAIFDILGHGIDWRGIEGVAVLDVFAGAGGFGLEALSRGAASATFIDLDGVNLAAIRDAAASLGEDATVETLRLDASRLGHPPSRFAPFDLALLDPPYDSGLGWVALGAMAANGWLRAEAIAVVETRKGEPTPVPSGFEAIDARAWGRAQATFLLRLG